MRDGIVVGKCGRCGGVVSVPRVWMGVQRAPETCESCGALADVTRGLPTLPMRDAKGLHLAPAQHEPATRPPGPWDFNTTGE